MSPSPTPFERAALVGQPFTLSNLSIPVNATVTCNCLVPGTPLVIVNSAPATCPHCAKFYVVTFNPQNGQLAVGMGQAEPAKETS